MSDKNDKGQVFKEASYKVINAISPRLTKWIDAFPSLMEVSRRIAVPVQVALALVGLVGAAWYGYQWSNTSTNLSNRIQTSLKEKLDNTVWQHKGFAAYLLSDIEGKSTQASSVENSPTNDEFLTKVRCIEKVVNQEANRKIVGRVELSREIDNLTREESGAAIEEKSIGTASARESKKDRCVVPNQKELKFRISGPTDGPRSLQAMLVDGESDFLIFLPAMALRFETDVQPNSELNNLSYDSVKRPNGKLTDGLRAALIANPDIVRDLQLAKKLSGKLKEFDSSIINGNEVVQSYFIAESGLILIRSEHVQNQSALYEIQFPKAYYFPDRDYVWGAIRGRDTQKLKGLGLDYESEPYIDLGGHGLIKTFSKKLELANGRHGVICVDVNRSELEREVKDRLNVLRTEGDPYQEVDLVINDTLIEGPKGTGREALPKDFQWFSDKLLDKLSKHDPGETAELLGRIAAQQDIAQTEDIKVLRYTIPLSTRLEGEKRKVKLMLVTIDFERLWTLQNWRLIYLCVGLMIFIGVTINIFQDSFILKKEISDLVKRLDRVMQHANNPYARVNSENEFVSVNDCFLRLLGYGTKDRLEHEDWSGPGPRTFLSILDGPSQDRYKENLRISQSGAPTEPYSISLYTKDKAMLRAQVFGERIVFPTIRKQRYPQRFGIFLDWTAIDPSYEKTLTKGLDRDVRIIDSDKGEGGKFEIQFKNEDDRNRLSRLLMSAAELRTRDKSS